jgi:LysM repeat protein
LAIDNTVQEHESTLVASSSPIPVIIPEKSAESPVVKTAPAMPEPVLGEISVAEGMTWYRISRHYKKSLDSLHTWNGPDLALYPGRKIRLERKFLRNSSAESKVKTTVSAGGSPAENATVSSKPVENYEVKAGDSCYSIARKFGMKVERLLEINGKAQAILKVGEQIRIEKTP